MEGEGDILFARNIQKSWLKKCIWNKVVFCSPPTFVQTQFYQIFVIFPKMLVIVFLVCFEFNVIGVAIWEAKFELQGRGIGWLLTHLVGRAAYGRWRGVCNSTKLLVRIRPPKSPFPTQCGNFRALGVHKNCKRDHAHFPPTRGRSCGWSAQKRR